MKNIYQLKIGWLLLGNIDTASSRIHGINIHNYLLNNRIHSVIYQSNLVMNTALTMSKLAQLKLLMNKDDILIFQKIFDVNAIRLAKIARLIGIKTVLLQCDLYKTEMARTVDQVIVTSKYLKKYYDDNYNINSLVIEDAIEVDTNKCKTAEDKSKLQLVWIGNKDHWSTLDIVREAVEGLDGGRGFSIKTISDHPDADVKWSLNTVVDEILTGDIAIVPSYNTEWYKGKSNNRLTTFMALGLPVIATNIQAYSDIIINGSNGFLVRDIDEWRYCLSHLMDIRLREQIGRQAKNDVVNKFSIETIGNQWEKALRELVAL